MLVLEVKGGRIAFDGRTGAWTSTARDGTVHSIKDPFLQAQRSVKAIVAKAAALSFEGQAMPEFVHGHAVVFPDCDFTTGGDAVSAPRELVIDAGDLARDAAGRLMEIFRLWGVRRAAAPLTKKWVKRLGQHVLAPHFSLGLALGSALGWEEKALALLHEEQDICLDFLHLNPRAVVRGGAGTGKTVVAVERARRLAADGKDVLLLCFNLPLAHYLRGICASWEALPGRVWAGSYHELGRELCGRAGVAWNEPPEDDVAATQAFWNETSGVLLLEAAQKLGERFDALVVDEAQDFLTEWWAVLEALLKEGDRAPVTLVADPDQDLWQRESRFPEGPPTTAHRGVPRRADGVTPARFAVDGAGGGAEDPPLARRGRRTGEGGGADRAAPPEGERRAREGGDRRDAAPRELVPGGGGRAGGLPGGADRRRRDGRGARRAANADVAPVWGWRRTWCSSSTWTGAAGRSSRATSTWRRRARGCGCTCS